MTNMATTLPAPVAATNTAVLSEALAAVELSPKKSETELEEGEVSGEKEDEVEDDGKVKTVFDDAANFNVKHPLYSEWTLHFDSPASKNLPKTPSTPTAPVSQGGWMDDIRKVVSVNSVEEFWGLYNNIVLPSQLPNKANYYLFKDGIMPAWEDAANKAGGKWSIQLPRDKSRAAIDKMWLYTMLAAIGETFETPLASDDADAKPPTPLESDLVTGVIVSARPAFYRIAIWTRLAPEVTAPETDELMSRTLAIGRHFKTSVLGFDINAKFGGGLSSDVTFVSHKASERKGNKDIIVL